MHSNLVVDIYMLSKKNIIF